MIADWADDRVVVGRRVGDLDAELDRRGPADGERAAGRRGRPGAQPEDEHCPAAISYSAWSSPTASVLAPAFAPEAITSEPGT